MLLLSSIDKCDDKIKTLLEDPSTYIELRSNPLNKIEKTVDAFVSDLQDAKK